jgi:hypothetical protein
LAIALAYSGRSGPLDSFVESLSREAIQGGTTLNNENLGHQLTYFGDQPFDFLYPTLITTEGNCRATVQKLLAQLNMPELAASWRLDAFTIYYLCTNDRWRESALVAAKEERHLLVASANKMVDLGWDKHWPELNGFIELGGTLNG